MTSAAGAFGCWWDSTNHVMTCNDNASGSNANLVTPLSAQASNSWVTYIDNTGLQHALQPAFSNISGTASLTTQVTGVLPAANGGTAVANTSSCLLYTSCTCDRADSVDSDWFGLETSFSKKSVPLPVNRQSTPSVSFPARVKPVEGVLTETKFQSKGESK